MHARRMEPDDCGSINALRELEQILIGRPNLAERFRDFGNIGAPFGRYGYRRITVLLRAGALADEGDLEWATVWRRILEAIDVLTHVRREGEALILVCDIGRRVVPIGQRPALAHHPAVQILAPGRAHRNHPAILVNVMWHAIDRLAASLAFQGESCLVAAPLLAAARLAELVMFRGVDTE